MDFLNFLINNWYMLIIAIVAIAVIIYGVITFMKRPTNEQLEKVKSWLLAAVTEAEKQLGSGTGQVKLSYVYNMFITKFPGIATFISYETFGKLVDEVLEKMRNLLASNKSLQQYVYGESEPETESEASNVVAEEVKE